MLRAIAVVIAGLVLGVLTTAALACDDSASTPRTPPPQVQVPPPGSQT